MKAFVKLIIAGAVVIGLGLAILIIALGANGWTFNPKYETLTYTADGEVTKLELDFGVGGLDVKFYEGSEFKVDYPSNDLLTTEFEMRGTTLSAETKQKRWYFFTGKIPATTVYIPEGLVISLDLDMNAGAASIAGGNYDSVSLELNAGALTVGKIVCDKFELDVNAGAVNVDGVECNSFSSEVNAGSAKIDGIACNRIEAQVNAGGMTLEIAGAESEYNLTISKSAGSCNKTSRSGTDPDKVLRGTVSAGSLTINFTD